MDKFTFYQWAIPEYMRDSLELYVEQGIMPGGFLTKVLENNLVESCGRADDNNLANLPAYANYLYNHAPAICWGSPEKVSAWLEMHREKRERRNEKQVA